MIVRFGQLAGSLWKCEFVQVFPRVPERCRENVTFRLQLVTSSTYRVFYRQAGREAVVKGCKGGPCGHSGVRP
jgi:hypothetical protein